MAWDLGSFDPEARPDPKGGVLIGKLARIGPGVAITMHDWPSGIVS